MAKKETLNRYDVADIIAHNHIAPNEQLYRLFKVYHPVVEAPVNITTEETSPTYHTIEKHMDMLVTGRINDDISYPHKIYIKNKMELFSMLGLDSYGYEIAEIFYNDLIKSGHFKETEKGIKPLTPAYESVKFDCKKTASKVKKNMLFDQYTGRLMPKEFYELQMYAKSIESIDEDDKSLSQSFWVVPSDMNVHSFNLKVQNHKYHGNEQIEFNLPSGYKSMSIDISDSDAFMKFYPYYLAVVKHNNKYTFKTFSVDQCSPLPGVDELYTAAEYKVVQNHIMTISNQRPVHIKNPVNFNFNLVEDSDVSKYEGVKLTPEGNFIWTPTPDQIQFLIGSNEEGYYHKSSIYSIIEREYLYINVGAPGRRLKINKNASLVKFLTQTLDATPEDRKALYYLNYNVN